MNLLIPNANTYPNVAKEQHLVPRTYMRNWSYNDSGSIYVLNKEKKETSAQITNVNSINYVVGFHDIKAGDIFVPDEALEDLFGFIKKCKISCGDRELENLRALNDNFYEFDNWIIEDEEGNLATKSEKNEIKRVITQSRYTFIETAWCYQYEDNWINFISGIENKVRNANLKVLLEPLRLSEREVTQLMEYILIYDFRNINGNAWINQIIDEIFPEELAEIDIPKNERIHKFNKTIGDEMKHEVRIKAFYEFLKQKNGKMKLMIDNYLNYMSLRICLTTEECPFLTCETPSMMIKNRDGLFEHIFVATPTMLITTYKTDNTHIYRVEKFTRREVRIYNGYIADNGVKLITNKVDFDFEKLGIK